MTKTGDLLATLVAWQGEMSDAAFCRERLRWARSGWWRIRTGKHGMSSAFLGHLLAIRPDLADEVMDEIRRRKVSRAA